MTKVKLFELIRRGHKLEEKGIRALAREHRVHRRVVREALANAVPKPRKITVRPAPVLGPFLHHITDWLEADREAPRKQRHTGDRIWRRLRDEHGCTAAASTVRREVARLRRKLAVRSGGAFVPLAHEPAREAEGDFYEAHVDLPGGRMRLHHFCLRACHSGREFHVAFGALTQQALLEALNLAFAHFGGVFHVVRFDNLGLAVKKVLKGRKRSETDAFIALRSHYLFESVFCKPGEEGAHEKGGVEGGLGRFRRHHLTPVPAAPSLDAYNAFLADRCAADDRRTMAGRRETVADAWAREVPLLLPLPDAAFETDVVTTCQVDGHGRVSVGANRYSVPIALHGLRVEVRLGAREVRCLHAGRLVARHDRLLGRGEQSLALDHYLDLLAHRPGAFGSSLPLAQARTSGTWPAVYDRLWEALKARHGLAAGTVEMVEVLKLHREHPRETMLVAAELALERGCLEAAALRHLAHHLAEPLRRPPPLEMGDGLPHVHVPLPGVAVFDGLLSLARAAS